MCQQLVILSLVQGCSQAGDGVLTHLELRSVALLTSRAATPAVLAHGYN